MKKTCFLFIILFCSIRLFAQKFEIPKLEFVCELKVTNEEIKTLGMTQHGIRRILPITGGTFEGPKLRGIVLNGGADYQLRNQENTRTEVEAIFTIQTNDSVLIHVRDLGLIIKTKEVIDDLAKGKPFDWNKMYFRTSPKFEAPTDSKYAWLNNAIFISRGVPNKDYVSIQIWEVL